jgi:hypothetical protein
MKHIDMIQPGGRVAREVEAAARRVVERGTPRVIDGREGMALGDLRLVNLEAGVALLAPGRKAGDELLTYVLDQDGEAAKRFRAKVCDIEVTW